MGGIEQSLRTLRDVQGVYGSFVIAGTGALVASDLPAAFDGGLFEEVGPRVTRLYETFLSGAEELDACMLRFAEHKIYLRKMTWGVIGILSAVGVNMPALRMVANLVIRKNRPRSRAGAPAHSPAPGDRSGAARDAPARGADPRGLVPPADPLVRAAVGAAGGGRRPGAERAAGVGPEPASSHVPGTRRRRRRRVSRRPGSKPAKPASRAPVRRVDRFRVRRSSLPGGSLRRSNVPFERAPL